MQGKEFVIKFSGKLRKVLMIPTD